MELEAILDNIINKSNANIKAEQGDYLVNGLLYCGKCKTPKQVEVEILGEIKRPMAWCKCETEKQNEAYRELKRQQLESQIQKNRRIGFANSDLINCTFANDDKNNKEISTVGLKYVENFKKMKADGKGLLFYGLVGTGKTYIASCIANALIDKGYRCLVTNFARLVNTLQGMYTGKQEYIDSLNKFDLLVIDDLSAERDTEYMNEVIQLIINDRYRVKLPLIVTTNLTAKDLAKPADIKKERVYSRLLEMCVLIEVKGENRRQDKIKKNIDDYKQLLGL
jgi:DNA replication protein DnaC